MVFKVGDVTQDNAINIFDILAIQKHISGISILTNLELSAADVTGDKEVELSSDNV